MGEQGCFSRIIGGTIKGLIIGASLGAIAGVVLRQNPQGIANLAVQGAQILGPASWSDYFDECGGQQQSPIDIQTKDLKKRKTKKPLKWTNYSNVPRKMVLQNSLHSIHSNGVWKNTSSIPYITNGPLEKKYYFSQLHFHWGKTNDKGSEHTVNRKSFPVEMHVVHDRLIEEPTNLSEESNSDHLVVVAYMFEIVRNDNPALNPILNGIKEVRGSEKKKVTIKPFPLDDLVESFHGDYVSYKGSLTTPPCTEGVIWIINSKPLGISDRQRMILWMYCLNSEVHFQPFMMKCTSLRRRKNWRSFYTTLVALATLRSSITEYSGSKIHNHRPVQNLNGRNIYYIYC